MLLLPFLLAANAQKPSPPTVSLTVHAEPLSKVVEEVSNAAGAPMKAVGDISGDVVAIAVHDVTLDELMSKLAEATDGEWTQSGKVLYLNRSDKALGAHRAQLVETRAKAFAKPSGFASNLDRAPITDLIGLETLAKVTRGESVTFSTAPEPGQIPLPPAVNRRVQDAMSADSKNPPPSGAVVKTVITSTWLDQDHSALLYLSGEATYSSGRTVDAGDWTLATETFYTDWEQREAAEKTWSSRLSLAPMTQDFASAYSHIWSAHLTAAEKAARARVRKRLTKATKIDPLWYASDLLISYATAKHEQFVGDLPDRLTDDTLDDILNPTSAAAMAVSLKGYASVESIDADGWITIRPRDPDFTASSRVDRSFLDEIGAYASGQKPLTMDALASLSIRGLHTYNYLEGSDSRVNINDPVTIWANLAPFPTQLVLEQNDMSDRSSDFYGFWLDLSPDQRATLDGGGSVQLADLTTRQRRFANQTVSDAVPVGKHIAGPTAFVTFKQTDEDEYATGARGKFTTIIPSWTAIPLSMARDVGDVLDLSRSRPGSWDFWNRLELSAAQVHYYVFTVHAVDGFTADITYSLHDALRPEEPIPWRKMPADDLKRINAAIDAAHKKNEAEEKKLDGAGGGGAGPP